MRLNRLRAAPCLMLIAAGLGLAQPAFAAKPGCTIYEMRNYGGAWYKLRNRDVMLMINPPEVGTSDAIHRFIYYPEWNDDVSSFRVDPGCTLTLWEHINEGGHHFRSSSSYTFVGSGWNDRASQADCVCPTPGEPNW